MEEYDRPPAGITSLDGVELNSSSTGDRVGLHGLPSCNVYYRAHFAACHFIFIYHMLKDTYNDRRRGNRAPS
jgi:hypothetical protein